MSTTLDTLVISAVSSAITSSALTIQILDGLWPQGTQFSITIDSEQLLVTSVTSVQRGGPFIFGVVRGQNGTTATSHSVGAQVTLLLTTNITTSNITVPLQTGNAGKVLGTDGTSLEWVSGGSGNGANSLGTYITNTSTNAPNNAQVLASLTTGILKVTTATGVLSTAIPGTDYVIPSGNITGTSGGLSANIVESQVTNLTSDLNTLTTLKAPLASPIFTGTVTIGSISGILKASSGVISVGTAGTDFVAPGTVTSFTKQQNFTTFNLTDSATISWDLNVGQVAQVTLGGNRTLALPTNMVNGGTYILRVLQDINGSRTLTFASGYRWSGGTAPTLSTSPNAVDYITFVSDGTHMDGAYLIGYA